MKTPDSDALRFAAEWLRQYDDSHDGGEGTATAEAVAKWLDRMAMGKDIRDVARQHGVPTAALRAKLAKE
jgi:hypothetical protein